MNRYCWFVRGAKHAAMCSVSIESVRKIEPKAKTYVLTDEPAAIIEPFIPRGTTVIEFAGGGPIMLANLEAQIQMIGTLMRPGGLVTFLDTDVLKTGVVDFDAPFDLLVTWRDHVGHDEKGEPIEGLARTMPYNYGVLSAMATVQTLEAFVFMRERIRRMTPGLQHWYGNQVALAALCGPRPSEGQALEKRDIPWIPTQGGKEIIVCKMPGMMMNYTPRVAGEDLSQRVYIHLKGASRGLMEGYAKQLGLNWPKEAA